MTRDEILNMPAGYEMNKLIAEHIFGMWIEENHGMAGGFYWVGNGVQFGDMRVQNVPDYSTDISAAWEVYEKIISDCKSNNGEPDFFMLNAYQACPERGWYIAKIWAHYDGDIVEFELTAPSAPLAICRAALLAVEAV